MQEFSFLPTFKAKLEEPKNVAMSFRPTVSSFKKRDLKANSKLNCGMQSLREEPQSPISKVNIKVPDLTVPIKQPSPLQP